MNTDLPAGRALDALVAEKVMDDPVDRQIVDQHGFEIILCRSRLVLPRFSTDIAAAWTVIERLCPDHDGEFHLERNVDGHQGTGWEAHFGYHTGNSCRNVYANADTAPLAICRAALRAVEGKP